MFTFYIASFICIIIDLIFLESFTDLSARYLNLQQTALDLGK